MTLTLELRDLRDQKKKEAEESKDGVAALAAAAFDCLECQAAGLDEGRLCWIANDVQPIQFEPDAPHVLLDKQTLRACMSTEEPLAWLLGSVRSKGRGVCPVPIAYHEDAAELLQAEADLDAWGLQPLEGSPQDWPELVLQALRHVRGQKGLAQSRRMK